MIADCGHESPVERKLCPTCIRVKSVCRKVERAQARINAGIPLFGKAAAADWL